MPTDQEIDAYVQERNSALLSDDLDLFMAFSKKHLPAPFSSRYVAEISLHKLRTAVVTLPISLRRESYKWLTEKGMETWDDGNLAEI